MLPARLYILICVLAAISCLLTSACTQSVDAPGTVAIDTSYSSPADESSPVVPRQWPGWRGAGWNGVSLEQQLPIAWTPTDGVRWKAEVPGQGNSSPVVWNGRILLTSLVPGERRDELALLCFDRKSGQLLWQRELGPPSGRAHGKNGYASSTVATDGHSVFAYFGPSGLFCYDLDGRRRWHEPLSPLDHEWGLASSPILYGNLVIQTCDNEVASFIAAFHKGSGKLLWRTPRDSHGSWGTPVLVSSQANGKPRVELVVNGTGSSDGSPGYVIAYDPLTGRELWRVQGTTDIPCPTAIVGNDLVISTSGTKGPILAVKPGGQGDVTETRIVWRHPTGGPYVPTGLVCNDRLYTVSDSGVAACYDLADGMVRWTKRLRGTFSASLVAAENQIYAVNEQGDVYVFAALDRFELLAVNRMQEPCLATPAIAHGEIYLRTKQHLYCLAGRPSDETARIFESRQIAFADDEVKGSPSDVLPTDEQGNQP
jgi:outer membrane protein assembly factor BamB